MRFTQYNSTHLYICVCTGWSYFSWCKEAFQNEIGLQICVIICCRVSGSDFRFSSTNLFTSKYSSTQEPKTKKARLIHLDIPSSHFFWLWTYITRCQDKGIPLPTASYWNFIVWFVLQHTLHTSDNSFQETLWNSVKNKLVQKCFG